MATHTMNINLKFYWNVPLSTEKSRHAKYDRPDRRKTSLMSPVFGAKAKKKIIKRYILPIYPAWPKTNEWCQGCGLRFETVSRRNRVSSWSRLDKNCQRLGLGHFRLVPKTHFRPNCAGHIKTATAEMTRVGGH